MNLANLIKNKTVIDEEIIKFLEENGFKTRYKLVALKEVKHLNSDLISFEEEDAYDLYRKLTNKNY